MMQIKGLRVTFDEGTPLEKHVLNNFNLDVNDGDFVVILGSNGAGKSTLFNAILGLVDYEGAIMLDGQSIDRKKTYLRCRDIGVVYQDPMKGSAPNLSVAENLLLYCRGRQGRKAFLAKCAEDLTKYNVGLEENFGQRVKDLSGGMRQALSLYMATLSNPRLLLLDEHIAALDPKTMDLIMNVTDSIVKEKSMTTLMIIHNLDLALRYGNRLLLLKEGKVAFDIKGEEKKQLSKEKLLAAYGSELPDIAVF